MNSRIPQPYDISSYDYDLPEEMIAQSPAGKRDRSRLLVVDCRTKQMGDHLFCDITDFLEPGDLLVANNTKVFPARLLGRKETGGKVELLILEYPSTITKTDGHAENGLREALVTGLIKSSKRPKPQGRLIFSPELEGLVEEIYPDGKVMVRLLFSGNLEDVLEKFGRTPLPPYIRREAEERPIDRDRYQTVFARETGAVAAPTAGLHLTEELLGKLREKEVGFCTVTLHVGYGTFAPVRVQDIREHRIHSEFLTVPAETARLINKTREEGHRIFAVGTTTVRALEFAADDSGQVRQRRGWCDLYIYPGYRFKVVKNLITNFHLPRSSLLFMVSGLAGREWLLDCYRHAVKSGYRFFSYGDAMLIMT